MKNSFLQFSVSLLFVGILGIGSFVQAEELEKEITETSANTNLGTAREEIISKAVKRVGDELILQLVGKDTYAKNQKLIQNITSKEAGKFIPSYKTSELTMQNDQAQMKVTIKVSLSNLKDLLIKNDLLKKAEVGNQISITIKNADGFIMMEALKNELLARFPELNRLKEKSISNSKIEFSADIESLQSFSQKRMITLLNKKAEVSSLSDQTLEITLQEN